MFTVCPKCALTLVVTAADLRIAQGYVRCGRCLNVFNALARLSEERPSATPPPPDTPDTPAPTDMQDRPATPDGKTAGPREPAAAPPQPAEPPSALEDTGEIEIELDGSMLVAAASGPAATAEPWEREAQPPPAPENPPAPVPEELPGSESLRRGEQKVSETDSNEQRALQETPEQKSHETSEETSEETSGGAAGEPHASPLAEATASPAQPEPGVPHDTTDSSPSPQALDSHTNTPQQQPESAFELVMRRPRAGLAWMLGAGALAIALSLQIVNHYRDSLAANPSLSGPLSSVYSALGVKLAPRWNIHAYDVRQLGASVAGAAAGEIVVRASVKNSASRAQPLPLLRVTLQDRFGNRIAARDVPPGDYLPSSVAPSSLLAAGSRVDATMLFVDPGPQAVGFELDACLRQRSGEIACAHGP